MPPRGCLKGIQKRIDTVIDELKSIEDALAPISPIVFDAGWNSLTELRLAWSLARDARTKVESLNTVLFFFLKENGVK